MGGLAYTLAFFVVALSVIVAVHEYGHYIVGRWTGIEAEVFSIGFGPVLASRVDRRGTRWQIAALPFGGYVKFKGDADGASAKADEDALAAMNSEELRHTMHAAPLWARSATVAAGPIFNFGLSILVFAAVLFARGEAVDPLTIEGIAPLPPAYVNELQPGDQILAIAGERAPNREGLGAFLEELPDTMAMAYRVRRDGEEIVVQGPHPQPPLVRSLSPQSAALDVEMRVGDVVTAIDGVPVASFAQMARTVAESEGRALVFDVWRNGEELQFAVAPRRTDLPRPEGGFETRWLIGVTGDFFFTAATASPGPLTALWGGVGQTWFIITSSISGLWHMITGAISSCNLSGPIGIAETSGAMASQGVLAFIWFVAVLSTAVGLLNLFPIPILDGGHLVFYAYEAVAGRPPSQRALQILMGAGLTFILSLMLFAVATDIFCP